MLSPEQVQHYRDRGYVKASGIMTDAEVDTLRRVTDDFIEKSRTVRASDKVFDVEDCHTPENPRLRRLKRPEDQHPAYAAIFNIRASSPCCASCSAPMSGTRD